MKFEFSSNSLDKISADALVIFAFQGDEKNTPSFVMLHSFKDVDAKLKGKLTKIASLEKYSGKRGEILICIPDEDFLASRICVVGLGENEHFTANDLRRAIGVLAKRLKGKIDSLAIVFPTDKELSIDKETASYVVAEAMKLATYEFIRYRKAERTPERELSAIIFTEQDKTTQKKISEGIKKARLYSESTILARDLVNETPTIATPTYLANLAKDIAKAGKSITCKVFDKSELEKMGMHAFLGIARASETPPKFIHLEYTPAKKSKEKIAIVGKGITFDSGGINVKPGDHIQDMKMDMSGAAAVLGIFSVLDVIKPKVGVIGLIAATPNLVSGSSIVPGDVVKALNGKTIEILNTDAEGRVTLADSLSYAVKEKATKIIDFATLTGACLVALGTDIAGLMSNNNDLTKMLESAASGAGEKIWELPLDKDYKDLNKSSVADIANIPNTRYAGTITAGLFLEEFVGDTAWAHLDIAGPAFADKPNDISQKGGTGFGVRTILNLLQDIN